EDPDALGVGTASEHRATRERPRDEDAGGSVDDPRHDGSLDGSPPARATAFVMALDDEHVGHAAYTAPRDRGLRRERAPPADDDRARPTEGVRDSRCERIVVVEDPLRAGHTQPAEVTGPMARVDLPRSPGHGLGGVDDGEIDIGVLRDTIEERRAVGSRLGED